MSRPLAYYNENDPKAAAWLRELIRHGHIARGDVDDRSIEEVRPSDVAGYRQCHFFAGIGGWSLALRLARWPEERPVWTGSCPCQPFSVAGLRKGAADRRHLWPEFFRLISAARPPVIFGEQVASADGLRWLSAVFADLEGTEFEGGGQICALRASGRRMSGKGSTGAPWTEGAAMAGWRSPQEADTHGRKPEPYAEGAKLCLKEQTVLAGWRSAMANDSKSGSYANGELKLAGQVQFAGWLTPTEGDTTGTESPEAVLHRRDNVGRLKDQALYAVWMPAGWNTPASTDAKGGYAGGRKRDGKRFSAERLDQTAQLVLGPTPVGSIAGTARSARLNPEFSRWLMGYPEEWGFCGGTAMRSCPRSAPSSSGRSSARRRT